MIRAILDPGEHSMRNAGGIALLQVAKERLHKLWPDATFGIITLAPHVLKLHFPDAFPIDPHDRVTPDQRERIERLHQIVPRPIWRLLFELREEVGHRWPALASGSVRDTITATLRARHLTEDSHLEPVNASENWAQLPDMPDMKVIHGADLYVATGAQYIADIVRDLCFGVLSRLETAIQHDIPTVMVGQGIGPLEDRELRARAKAVLPRVDYIFVREQRDAPHILTSLGVDPARIIFTGDDALELAYKARKPDLANGIGVGLRASYYTAIEDSDIASVGEVLRQTASRHHARLISLPISQSAHERDSQINKQVMAEYDNISRIRTRFHSPQKIINKTRDCRLVVSGTYHTAVFALAQGIPAVCVAKSTAYLDKLLGLAEQFDSGCQVLYSGDAQFREKLAVAIDEAWESAEQTRPGLLKATEYQISLGQAAYKRIYEVVESGADRDALVDEGGGNACGNA
jgi:polysaccharide pyruvyl transferase WcaK-like protein